jgi:GntR family transcriptional regulator, transcriptional repressor for pyruvate dehydrogenase complex
VSGDPQAAAARTEWKPVRRFRTHEQVLQQVEEQILRGRLRPGDRLPPERQLAETLGVSRSAVREALRVLESMGVISASTGSGPSAGSIIVGEGTPALGTLLRIHLALSSYSQSELVEVRVQLERWAAKEAATRTDGEALEELHDLVAQMRKSVDAPDRFNELDTAFHVGVATISGNSLLATLMQALRDAVQREMVHVFATLDDSRAVMESLCEEHQGILDAIVAGDPERAARLVQQHIENFYAGHDVAPGSDR